MASKSRNIIILFFTLMLAYTPAQAFSITAFFKDIFLSKPGGRAIDDSEGKDLSKLTKSGMCPIHYPWGEPEISDKEVQKRLLYFCNLTYASGYDPITKVPLWTMEILDTFNVKNMAIGKYSDSYMISELLPSKMSSKPEDYLNSGYDFGHMASKDNMFVTVNNLSPEEREAKLKIAMDESFTMSNIVPMVGPNLKNNIWLQLETITKLWAIEKKQIYVVTGPLFLGGQKAALIGASQVAVPTHFFKIITDPQNYGSISYIIPNKEVVTANTIKIFNPNNTHYCQSSGLNRACTLNDFIVPIQEVERLSGMKIYPKLAPHFAIQVKQDINEGFKKDKK